jgi:hypothetical protein
MLPFASHLPATCAEVVWQKFLSEYADLKQCGGMNCDAAVWVLQAPHREAREAKGRPPDRATDVCAVSRGWALGGNFAGGAQLGVAPPATC